MKVELVAGVEVEPGDYIEVPGSCGITLQKRHRMEIAEEVARFCIGHKMEDVATRLGHDRNWVRQQLDFAGISAAIGGGGDFIPPLLSGGKTGSYGQNDVWTDANRVVSEFGPLVKIKIADDGKGNQQVAGITGDDAEDFAPYLGHYLDQGHEPAAATRLAKFEWAAEAAVETGVIKESKDKNNKRVNRILFPEDASDIFDLDLKMYMARVQAAAEFLNTAKMPFLSRKSTCELVAAANGKWAFQVERILNLHPNFR